MVEPILSPPVAIFTPPPKVEVAEPVTSNLSTEVLPVAPFRRKIGADVVANVVGDEVEK